MSLRINRVLYVQINENKNLCLIVGVNGHIPIKDIKKRFFSQVSQVIYKLLPSSYYSIRR
jgi:hypothetical protein